MQKILLMSLALMLSFNATAQSFAFVSDRISNLNAFLDPDSTGQTDIFLYDKGSEVRLTQTNHQSEYDPSPSADGRYIAFASSNRSSNKSFEDSSWTYQVLDLKTDELTQFAMPNSLAEFRPAGSFGITWLASQRQFLAQAPSPEGWQIHLFDLETEQARYLTDGFGILLNDAQTKLATAFEGQVKLFDLQTNDFKLLTSGEPFGWLENDLIIARENSLRLISSDTGRGQELFDFFGFYTLFAWSPDETRYAFSFLQQDTWFVAMVTREHAFIREARIPGVIDSMTWLDEETLLLAYSETSDTSLGLLSVEGELYPLMNSIGTDFAVKRLP